MNAHDVNNTEARPSTNLLPNLKKAIGFLDRRERRHIFYMLFTGAVFAVAELLNVGSIGPFLGVIADPELVRENEVLSWIYNRFGFTSNSAFLVFLGILVFGALVFRNLANAGMQYVTEHFREYRTHSLSRKLLQAYMARPYAFFLNQNSSNLSRNVLAESARLVGELLVPAIVAISRSFVVLGIVGLLVTLDPVVAAIVSSGLLALYGLTYLAVRRRLTSLGEKKIRFNAQRFRTVVEAFSGIKEIKLLGMEGFYLGRYNKAARRFARANIGAKVLQRLPRYALEIVIAGALLGVVMFLLLSETSAASAVPLVGVYAFASYRIRPALQTMLQNLSMMRTATAVVADVEADLSVATEWDAAVEQSKRGHIDPLPFRRELRLENVSFAYPEAEEYVISNQSLEVACGECVALVGPTGCGKTTFVDLALGLLRPQHGRILVDDVELTDENLPRWQANLGYVPQNIYLSDDSVAENIAFGAGRDVDMDRVKLAAQLAHVDEFIERELPDGYGTLVGERGIRLSGGQRQRIGIARALYLDPEILVLDEATSALDPVTEAGIIDSVNALSTRKTVIMVAHRVMTVERCDRIIMLKSGRVVDEGDYASLMRDSEEFRRHARASE